MAVPREEDVKFQGLCEARGVPALRIGVTTGTGADATLEVQDHFEIPLTELGDAWRGTLPKYFGPVITE